MRWLRRYWTHSKALDIVNVWKRLSRLKILERLWEAVEPTIDCAPTIAGLSTDESGVCSRVCLWASPQGQDDHGALRDGCLYSGVLCLRPSAHRYLSRPVRRWGAAKPSGSCRRRCKWPLAARPPTRACLLADPHAPPPTTGQSQDAAGAGWRWW